MAGTSAFTAPILRGDQALAWGALAAGVRVVTGYPGSPATGVFDSVLEMVAQGKREPGQAGASDLPPLPPFPSSPAANWAPNEKVALEIAYGASLGGARSLVVLKGVGLNIALDPLATMSYSGCHAGLVILLGEDPGGWASQNEQDSRWLARVAEVPLVEPCTVEHSAALMAQAYAWSESLGTPVIVRATRALTLAQAPVEEPWQLPPSRLHFWRKRNRWVVLPANVVARHRSLHRRLGQMQALFEASPYDVSQGEGPLGVIAVGYTGVKLRQALRAEPGGMRLRVLDLTSLWPLPERALARWLSQVEHVLVLEEGNSFTEEALRDLAQREQLPVRVAGRADGLIPAEGEVTPSDISAALARLGPFPQGASGDPETREMPSKVPLCDDCPYRPTFDALLGAIARHGGRERHIIVGETGCMVRANLPPLELFDVKYSLGAGLGLALGLVASGTPEHVVALLGDSSFFHTDLNALPYAVQANPTLLMVVLDNGTTALSGGQPHPGSLADERGQARAGVDLEQVLRGCGAQPVLCTPQDVAALEAAFDQALSAEGLRVIVVRGPCPRYVP